MFKGQHGTKFHLCSSEWFTELYLNAYVSRQDQISRSLVDSMNSSTEDSKAAAFVLVTMDGGGTSL